MESRYGNGKKFPSKLKNLTNKIGPDPLYKNEFLYGYENEDLNRDKYMDFYKDSGLLNSVYPKCQLNQENIPRDLIGDRFLTSAWLLKDNPLENIAQIKDSGWTDREINDIIHLINIYKIYKNKVADNELNKLHSNCGLPGYKVNKWIKLI